jgi:hypothetical protein
MLAHDRRGHGLFSQPRPERPKVISLDRREGNVPAIVPETRQNSVARANGSQVARFVKWKNEKDLGGKSKVVERRISV